MPPPTIASMWTSMAMEMHTCIHVMVGAPCRPKHHNSPADVHICAQTETASKRKSSIQVQQTSKKTMGGG